MSYSVFTIPPFDKQLKRLAKKYPSLKDDFTALISNLIDNPEQGVPLGKNCRKIRMAIKSKGKGKSGGARIITNLIISEERIYLLTIYDKANRETLTDKELQELLGFIQE